METARGRTKQGRKQRYKKKVDIKISRCSAGGSAPALGKNVSAAGGRKSERFEAQRSECLGSLLSRRDYGNRKRADKAGKETEI